MTAMRRRRLPGALLGAAAIALVLLGDARPASTLALWSRSAPIADVAFGTTAPETP